TLHGETVDRCDACIGMWFDQRELSAVLGRIANSSDKESATERAPKNLSCPRCAVPMPTSDYAYDSGIAISRCSQCSGVWLDRGQLESVANYRAGTRSTNALAAAHTAKLRTDKRWEFLQDAIRSRWASGFVALLYVVTAQMFRGPEASLRVFVFVLLPLACIWFSDGLGNLTGISFGLQRPTITQTTAGEFVAIGGWLLLLCPLFAALLV
ncbi:MAG: Zn-finger nucleic acid-binding protein, partial [Pirellulaceae bacterium]